MAGEGDLCRAGGAQRPGRGEQDIPAPIRRNWEAASAEVANMIFAAPDLYERAMRLIRRTADALRPECPDLASLLAFADRAEVTAAATAEELDVSTAGLRLDLIASVALAMRGREIAEERVRRARLDRLGRARKEGRAWALVEELGDQESALVTPYRRTDVHVASGTALVACIEPDETFVRVVYRLWWARLDPATGRLGPGEDAAASEEQYVDRETWAAALADARRRLA